MATRFRGGALAATTLLLAGCSVLAPSDDEFLGGSGSDAGASGGASGSGGASTGGSAGTGASTSGGGSPTGGGGSPTGGGGSPTGGGGSPTGGGGSPTGGGGSPTGGGGSPTGGGGSPTGGGGSPTGGGGTGGTTCTPVQATAVPLDRAVYVMLDRSASMSGANWSGASSAVHNFTLASKSANVQFGLQFFPTDPGGTCAGGGYSTPAVGFGVLPGLSAAVTNALNSMTPNGTTALEGAFNGGTSAGKGYLTGKPATQFDLVFITDVTATTTGGGCSSSDTLLQGILSSAWPAVATHFIGLPGSTKAYLDAFADAGGTESSTAAITSNSIATALLQATTSCRFSPPASGGAYTLSGGALPFTKVSSPSACQPQGWFEYGGNAVLCPALCQQVAQNGLFTPITTKTVCP